MKTMKQAYRLDESKRAFEKHLVTWQEKHYIEYRRDGEYAAEAIPLPGIHWFDYRKDAQAFLDYIDAPENQAL